MLASVGSAISLSTAFCKSLAEVIASAARPLIVAGGGVHYSLAEEALAALATRTGIPVGESQAGKGSLRYDHPQSVGAIGSTGTTAATVLAQAIFTEGLRHVTAGANPMGLKRGLEAASAAVVEALKKGSIKVTERAQMSQVASISANNDPSIGNLIGHDALPVQGANVYDILRHKELVLSKDAVIALEARLK